MLLVNRGHPYGVAHTAGMRWQALFADLSAQLDAVERADLDAEVRDRTRREGALVRTVDRLSAVHGQQVAVTVHGAGTAHGELLDTGVDWLLLREVGAAELLVPLSAVLGVTGLSRWTGVPGEEGEVGRRLDLRWALRGVARSRAAVELGLTDGSRVDGTLDRVGADHLELAQHAPGEPRRATAVRGVRLVPLSALALVRHRGAG